MAISNVQKEKLKELELSRGGVAFVRDRTQPTPIPTVIISLGGLGGRTLNSLKGKFAAEINECDHVWFRMIDTSENDMNDILKVRIDGTKNPLPDANIDPEEAISLYHPSIVNILDEVVVPPYIRSWLNPELIGTQIKNDGAQATRQIGRTMLCNDTVYNNVRMKLQTVLSDAINYANSNGLGNVDVIIIAGVSGGTGSGSIIDISYMVHDIFKSLAYESGYNISSYIYTPDVQFEVPAIKVSEPIRLNLQKNGYAALKEIDYFMNLEETKSLYELSLGTKVIRSERNIFRTCTLISGYSEFGGLKKPEDTIAKVTDQMMDLLTNIQFIKDGIPQQLSKSLLSNERAGLNAWLSIHPSRKEYHRNASYKYQILGYSSLRIPRDEILAYCVNKIYQAVLQQFQDFTKVDKQLMMGIFKKSNTIKPEILTNTALSVNSDKAINRHLVLEGPYTKAMIKQNPFVAFQDAQDLAHREALKIDTTFQTLFEAELYNRLLSGVDEIFQSMGPYAALKAIEHRHEELSVGNPKEPFPGIIEQLQRLSNAFIQLSNRAKLQYEQGGGQANIQMDASNATSGLFTNNAAIQQYIQTCIREAVAKEIDAKLFNVLAESCHNVAVRLNEYNNQLFDIYTSVLTQIQNTLNRDGQYFSVGHEETVGNKTSFSIDIIRNGQGAITKLQRYLDAFISDVSVDQLSSQFIKSMRDNKDRWLSDSENDGFDPVSEVRDLIDSCFENNKMKSEIIEKFVTVAYSPMELTPEQLDAIWEDNSIEGPKYQALQSAANQIYTMLNAEAKAMAHGTKAFSNFQTDYFIGLLKDTPELSKILTGMLKGKNNYSAATSTAKDKFIFVQQYYNIPAYIIDGMKDYNNVYLKHLSAGIHMDERKQNWTRFPNPYTLDSVALDLKSAHRPAVEIEDYPDYKILKDIQIKLDEAIDKYGCALLETDHNHVTTLSLLDITREPADQEEFNKKLYDEVFKNGDVNLAEFMSQNGYVIHPVMVSTGFMDIDLSMRTYDGISFNDPKYGEVPVPITDLYKWVRKSMKNMDILLRNHAKFEELDQIVQKAKEDSVGKKAYINNVRTFVFALRAGLVKQKDPAKVTIWNYMEGKNPVQVNLNLSPSFDKEYYLYQVFEKFQSMGTNDMQRIHKNAMSILSEGDEADTSLICEHISEMLDDSHLGDAFNVVEINQEAEDQGVEEHYVVTDKPEDMGNPFMVLRRFYDLAKKNF